MQPGRRLAISLAVPAAFALVALARLQPPAPLPEDAPATAFSAARALPLVAELAGDGAPRPAGSAANLRAVEVVVGRLRALGLSPEVQETFACGIYGTCSRVRNVLARLEGPDPARRAVLVMAHHDSVGAGPGASDDLAGVAAALEVARALGAGPRPPRPVLFLITDAEESVLVGASAFLDQHPARREVGAVVNLEARGTAGPSILFDTGGDPPWLGDALAALPRPVTFSVASGLYDLLPNDTDLAAFNRAGLPSVNLAFVGGAGRYHTPRDDVAHLDPASLQHQGENALALVRALAAEDLERGSRTERAWFDVLSLVVVSWPFPREVAGAAALLALLAARSAARREARPARAALRGAAAALLGPLLAAAAAAALWLALRAAGAVPRAFVANSVALDLAAWAAGAAGALGAVAVAGRGAGSGGLVAGAAAVAAALSVALGLLLPAATPLAVVPALALALSVALQPVVRPGGLAARVVALVPAVGTALVALPVALLLPLVFGAPGTPVAAALVAAVALPAVAAAAPVEPRLLGRAGAGALAAALALAAAQAAIPHATLDVPDHLTFAYQVDGGTARWLAELEHPALPPAVRAVAAFSEEPGVPLDWQPMRRGFVAPAPDLGLPAARLDVLSSEPIPGGRLVRARLWSPRGAPVVLLLLPGGGARVTAVRVEGIALAEPPPLAVAFLGGHRLVGSWTTPPEGVTVELAISGDDPIEATVVDQSPGLPAEGAALVAARPATAVPLWQGDTTLTGTDVKL